MASGVSTFAQKKAKPEENEVFHTSLKRLTTNRGVGVVRRGVVNETPQLGVVGCGRVWLGVAGFGWVWLGLAGFGWVWLVVASFS